MWQLFEQAHKYQQRLSREQELIAAYVFIGFLALVALLFAIAVIVHIWRDLVVCFG